MATVSIFAKKDYLKKDGTLPIYLRLVIDRKVCTPLNLNCRTRPGDWDDALSRTKPSHPNHHKLNAYLDQQQRKAADVLLDHQLSARPVTYQSFIREFTGLSPYDFYYATDQYVNSIRSRRAESYVKKVGFVVGKLRRYAPELNLSRIDFQFIDQYMIYLQQERKNSQNTINSNIKILRRIFKHAIKLKLAKENPFTEVRLEHIKTERDSLQLEELLQYEKLLQENLPYYLHKTLCWFLLSCYTGRRYEDLKTFYEWEFYPDHIKTLQQKRVAGRVEKKIILLPLNDRIRTMAEKIKSAKYKVIGPSSREFLQTINGIVGTQKHITFHSGRHTFSNINKELTEDITIRRDLLGHDSVKSTLIYDHINQRQLQAVMEKWNHL